MNKIMLFSLCFWNSFSCAQEISLKNKIFISSFKHEAFSLSGIKTLSGINWLLFAGSCDREIKKHSEQEYELFNSIIAGINRKIDTLSYYSDSAFRAKTMAEYYNCMEEYYGGGESGNTCDTILKVLKRGWWAPSKYTEQYINMIEEMRDSFEYKKDYRIFYRFPNLEGSKDSLRYLNLCKAKGFGTWMPPGYANWFIVLSNKEDKTEMIDTHTKLINFLGDISNPHAAFMIFKSTSSGLTTGHPVNGENMKYKKHKGKIYFIEKIRFSDCPVIYYQCLVSVDKNGEVEIVDKIQDGEGGGCI